MKIITKIKRLSSEYRKHEKEIKDLEVKYAIEAMKTTVSCMTLAVQIASIANMPKHKPELSEGGIIPTDKFHGDN